MPLERLQKIIAQAGIASRRKAEAIITEGRVRVNGKFVTQLGAKADPERDRIEVDGKRISRPRAWTYVLLFKPSGVVTTASDELGRKTVLDLVKGESARLFPVGRLDYDVEGALLLTNDGDVAAALTHPSGEVMKVYRARVRGRISDEGLAQLTAGLVLEDGPAKALTVRRIATRDGRDSPNAWIELTITEGRNHLVKRMLESIGHPVIRLRRVEFAELTLDGLAPGKWRYLRKEELKKLRAMARLAKRKRRNPEISVDDED